MITSEIFSTHCKPQIFTLIIFRKYSIVYFVVNFFSFIQTISNDTKVFRIKKAPIMEMNLDCTVNRMGADRTIINVGKSINKKNAVFFCL